MKIEFPDMQIWSERITLSRQFYVEVHGSKVKASDVTDKLWMPQNARNIFTFTTMGLNISGHVLPNPTELEKDSIDVLLLVEKAEEQFSGYTFNKIIQFNNDSDSNEVRVALSTDGLATEESFQITWTCSHKTAKDLENDEDRPKDNLNLGATYSRGNQTTSGFNFQYSSRGFKKSELNRGNEDSTQSFLSDITARLVKRFDYLVRLEITDNDNEAIPLLTWNLTNNKNDASVHLRFEGPLNKTLGIIQGSISKIESVDDDKFMITVYKEPKVHVKADLMMESVALGTNKLKTEFNFETGDILWNTSVERQGATFELVQTVKSSLIDEEFHGSDHVVKNTTRLNTYAAHYQDSYSNNGSFTAVYSYNYLDLGDKQYSTLKSIIIQADTNALKNPLLVELSLFKEFDSSGEIIYDGRKYLTLSVYWNIFGFQLGQFIYDRNKTETILTKDRFLCSGRRFRVYSDSNTFTWRCTASTDQLQIYAKNYFEFLLTSSNVNPNEISLDLYAYLPQTGHLVNITGIWEIPAERYKRKFMTTAFLDNIPYYGISWTAKSEMDFNDWNRTLEISNELTRNVSSSTTEWKAKIEAAWAQDILNGESSMKIVYDDPRHVTITVDILNNATTGSSATNKLTAVVDTAGLAKIFIPKKQLTWLVSVENDKVYLPSNIAFKMISDLKWESLSFLANEEIFHLREDFDVKIKYAFDWVLKGGGRLTSMENEIAAYNYTTHLNIFQSNNNSRNANMYNSYSSTVPVKLTLDATGWLSDETMMGKTVNNTFFVASQAHIDPQHKVLDHLLKFKYRQIKEQNVTESLDAELQNHYILKHWSKFVTEDQIMWTANHKTYMYNLWRRVAVTPDPMVSFRLMHNSENPFDYAFSAAVIKRDHQKELRLRWKFAHNASRVSHYSSFEDSAFDLSDFYLVVSG